MSSLIELPRISAPLLLPLTFHFLSSVVPSFAPIRLSLFFSSPFPCCHVLSFPLPSNGGSSCDGPKSGGGVVWRDMEQRHGPLWRDMEQSPGGGRERQTCGMELGSRGGGVLRLMHVRMTGPAVRQVLERLAADRVNPKHSLWCAA